MDDKKTKEQAKLENAYKKGSFGDVLKAYREILGKTCDEVGEALYKNGSTLTGSTVSSMERGKINVQAGYLPALIKMHGLGNDPEECERFVMKRFKNLSYVSPDFIETITAGNHAQWLSEQTAEHALHLDGSGLAKSTISSLMRGQHDHLRSPTMEKILTLVQEQNGAEPNNPFYANC